ncbi:hypothetical protein A1O7_02298 [Cladophialophora yegresii CBS 114405]|uniref:Uncharacterized protein n=1 Tax=Cladophialophora yegresii CBS 114405 TaxID=1182544 RepID=W9W1Q7_9EURO|nr:uncharacterized protein A1O7_02298 [Cladophialophora yegresii CBS 114405]EXJ61868.1 hypothetical protein A1O7_02298 [Cladophialophora yegresii CBS 114405]
MRLQLLIQRHSLPPVPIIFTTGTGPASRTKSPSATVADLLLDVSEIVPLESADGEWGLEDYAVEIAAKDGQGLAYECLHFQTVESVLRENDEVIVRALSNEDIRVRRLGKRHQITADGRHLIDGVPFGKQWLREIQRPDILIPPRKRRRLLAAEDSTVDAEVDLQRILPAEDGDEDYTGALVRFVGDDEDEDEEDDDDYVDNEEAGAQEPQRRITLHEEFDDADVDSEEEPELDGDAEAGDLSSEVAQLLEDAAEVEQASNLAIANHVLENQLKRKRPIEDDGEHELEKETFEGFSAGGATSSRLVNRPADVQTNGVSDEESDQDDGSDSMLDEITAERERMPMKNIPEDDEDDSDDSDATSATDTSSSDSDADSLVHEMAMQQAKRRALNLIASSETGVDEDETSSSGSDTDSDDEVSDTTSSSGSDSDSDDTSESGSVSSSESEIDSEAESRETNPKEEKVPEAPTITATSVGIPFEGTHRTHMNNNRAKRRKRLASLKQQGLLPPNADFKALAEYDAALARQEVEGQQQEQQRAIVDHGKDAVVTEDAAVLSRDAEMSTDEAVAEHDKENVNPRIGHGAPLMDDTPAERTSAVPEIPETSQIDSQSVMEQAPKRSRLDVASSRRLILGSLGVRAPRTAEERQKVMEKLSRDIRHPRQPKEEDISTMSQNLQSTTTPEHDDSWMEKLIVSAVECEAPGGVLPPPPFPFQQGWARSNKNKRKMRDQSQYYQGRNGHLQQEDEQVAAPDVATLNYDDDSIEKGTETASRVHRDADELPTEKELDSLAALEWEQVLPGATIAYRELHVDASTNYQPAVSPYRIGQVSHVDEDSVVHLQLDKGSFGSQAQQIDRVTGERVYGKFELAEEDADEDDGTRDVSYSSMIKPKLVEPSSNPSLVQVPDSSNMVGLRGGEAAIPSVADDEVVVPESAEQEQEIETQIRVEMQASIEADATAHPAGPAETLDTPRKREINGIIKEAGFESALDEQLLQPIMNPAADSENAQGQDDAQGQAQGKYAHRFRPKSPRVIITSSDQQPSSPVDDELSFEDDNTNAGISSIAATSSPYMPTQTTVEYPHISQMDIGSSAPVRTTDSSSHQDAQKLSPAVEVDLSSTNVRREKVTEEQVADKTDELDGEEDIIEVSQQGFSPLPPESGKPVFEQTESSGPREPEIEQSPVPQVVSDLVSSQTMDPGNEGSSVPQDSFLDGLGYDGNDSSYHESGLNEDSDLPSLSDFRSSRRTSRRTSTRSTKKKSVSPSPPRAARKSLRSSNASNLRSNASRRKRRDPSPSSSPELPPSSQPEFKQSQSQRGPRLSQIPTNSQVLVDLTFSSPPMSPIESSIKDKDDGDSDFTLRRKKNKKSDDSGTGRKTGVRGAKQASQDSGIGKRTLLTKKKDSDPKYY